MVKVYNKLVRDNIIDIIEQDGKHADFEILDETRYIEELEKKLAEEYKEYLEDHSLEEMCDMIEIIDAICKARGFSAEQIMEKRAQKNKKNGAFKNKIFLKKVED